MQPNAFLKLLRDAGTPTGDGGGGGTDTPPQTGGEPGSNADKGEGKGGTPAAASGDETETGHPPKGYSQDEVNEIVKQRLAEDRRRREAEEEERRLEADGKLQELADKRKAEIETLKPQADRAARYAALLAEQIDAEVAEWPAEVKALDPGGEDVEARLAWLQKSRPLAKKLAESPTAPETEAGKGNRPGGRKSRERRERPGSGYRFQGEGDVAW